MLAESINGGVLVVFVTVRACLLCEDNVLQEVEMSSVGDATGDA
jgi:hypothetical protein